MAKVRCDPKRIAIIKTETEEDGKKVKQLRLVIRKAKDENGEFFFQLMKECCTGACWIATIEVNMITASNTPTYTRLQFPVIPCTDRNCNMTAGYDMDVNRQETDGRTYFDTWDTYEPRYQWGGVVNYGTIYGLGTDCSRQLAIDFGFTPTAQNPGTPRAARIFMRQGTQFATLFQCRRQDYPYPQNLNIVETKPVVIMEVPGECFVDSTYVNWPGWDYPLEENGDMVEIALGEAVWGSYFFYSISNRYCPYKFDANEEVPELGMLPGASWGVTEGGLFYMYPPKDVGEGRAYMDWTPGAGAEEWLASSLPTVVAGGNVFMLDAEMQEFIDNGGQTYLNQLNAGDPITGVPARKLALPTGNFTVIDTMGYQRFNTAAGRVKFMGWKRCSRNHACAAWPMPLYTYDLRNRPSNMEPPLLPPLNPGGRVGLGTTPLSVTTKAANMDKYKCLNYDAATGECKKHGAVFNCAECEDSVGLPFDA